MSYKFKLILTVPLLLLFCCSCGEKPLPRQSGQPWVDVRNQLPVNFDGKQRLDAFPGLGTFFLDYDGEQIGSISPFNQTPPDRYAYWMSSIMYGDVIVLYGVDPNRVQKTIVEMQAYTGYTEYDRNGFKMYFGVDTDGDPNAMGVSDDFFIATSTDPVIDCRDFLDRLVDNIDVTKLP